MLTSRYLFLIKPLVLYVV